jgi:hypothetical protein
VLGISYLEADLRATTEAGAELVGSQQGSLSWRHYSPLFSFGNYSYMTLSFPMDPNVGYPLLLKEVSWATYALLYRQDKWVDVPFQVTGQWVEIVSGVRIQLTEATSRDGIYRYSFKAEFGGSTNPFMGSVSVSQGETLPGAVISKMQLLDAKGTVINGSGTSGSFGWSMTGGSGTANCTGHGDCDSCGDVKTMRFWVAVSPYEIKLPFVLRDIPVPTF